MATSAVLACLLLAPAATPGDVSTDPKVSAAVAVAWAWRGDPPAPAQSIPPPRTPDTPQAAQKEPTHALVTDRFGRQFLVPLQNSAPGVAGSRHFLDRAHAGHDCPSCGYQSPAGSGTWVVRGYNQDGTHVHSCPRCGTSWRH